MLTPSGPKHRYVHVNTVNEGWKGRWRQTEQVNERNDAQSESNSFPSELSLALCFVLFFLPPSPVSFAGWVVGGMCRERRSGLAAPDRAVLMGADDD